MKQVSQDSTTTILQILTISFLLFLTNCESSVKSPYPYDENGFQSYKPVDKRTDEASSNSYNSQLPTNSQNSEGQQQGQQPVWNNSQQQSGGAMPNTGVTPVRVSPDYYYHNPYPNYPPQQYQRPYYPPQYQQPQYPPQSYVQPSPTSRSYNNPYAIPPSNYYSPYDHDQYYVPPMQHQSIEPVPQQQTLAPNQNSTFLKH